MLAFFAVGPMCAFLIFMSWHRLVMTALFLWLIIPLVPTSTGVLSHF